MTHYPHRWIGPAEQDRPGFITLPILTQQLTTPTDAARLGADLVTLHNVFAKRQDPRDTLLLSALTDLAAGVRQYRRELDAWHDRQAAEFASRLETGESS